MTTNIFLQVAKYFYWTLQVHGDGPGESVGREEPGGQLQPPQQVGPGQVHIRGSGLELQTLYRFSQPHKTPISHLLIVGFRPISIVS